MRAAIAVAASVLLLASSAGVSDAADGNLTCFARDAASRPVGHAGTAAATPGPAALAGLGNARAGEVPRCAPAATAAPRSATGGGDTFATATVVPSLPYYDSGATGGFADDYSPVCGGSGSPDVVYSFTPAVNTCVTISLCGSYFDTVLHLYMDGPAGFVACNDDYCGGYPMASKLQSVSLEAGHAYYIVVDGYDYSAQGTYSLSVTTDCPEPCTVDCPEGAIQENETTTCNADGTNDGCNMAVPGFTDITLTESGVTVCGTYGSFPSGAARDIDYYRFVLTERSVVRFCATGEATHWISIVNLNTGCAGISTVTTAAYEPCVEGCLEATLMPGTYAFVAASIFAVDVPCGRKYRFTGTATPAAPCVAECPPGAILEGETTICDLNGTNDGCNMAVPAYTDIPASEAGVTVCGTYGSYPDGSMRDTDWFRLVLTRSTRIRYCIVGELDGWMAIVNMNAGCASPVVVTSQYTVPCQEGCLETVVDPGTYVLFIASYYGATYPCGARYLLTAACTPLTIADLHCNDVNGVATAKTLTVSVDGVVTASFPTGSASRFIVQGDGGGIYVYGTSTYCGQLGDSVHVVGKVIQSNGLTELSTPLTITKSSGGNPQPEPVLLTAAQLNQSFQPNYCEPNESRLVKVEKVTIVSASGAALPPGSVFAVNTNYGLLAEDMTLDTMRIVQVSPNMCSTINPLVGTTIPAGFVNVVGALVQSDASSPYTTGYQLQPRLTADITRWGAAGVDPGLPLVFAVGPAQPNPASRAVSFGMDLPAAARVEAAVFDITGRRVADVASQVYDAGRHTLRWSGLAESGAPAVSGVYYLRVRAAGQRQTRTFIVAH